MIIKEHPNVSLISQLDTGSLAENADLFARDFVWHFFNPKLPKLQGDYVGVKGLRIFFEKLAMITGGTFRIEPLSITPIGDELVVTHVIDRMMFEGHPIELDAVVVWRIVNGLIAEAWDIPSVYTEQPQRVHAKRLQTAA
ncbi:MAG: nuclear transport factor 2 family protein [Cyanobacteria bacterium J06635_15]